MIKTIKIFDDSDNENELEKSSAKSLPKPRFSRKPKPQIPKKVNFKFRNQTISKNVNADFLKCHKFKVHADRRHFPAFSSSFGLQQDESENSRIAKLEATLKEKDRQIKNLQNQHKRKDSQSSAKLQLLQNRLKSREQAYSKLYQNSMQT
eukprot:UN27890